MNKKEFDCVEFQRNVREEALKKANYNIKTLIKQVNERLKENELNIYLEDKKNKLTID